MNETRDLELAPDRDRRSVSRPALTGAGRIARWLAFSAALSAVLSTRCNLDEIVGSGVSVDARKGATQNMDSGQTDAAVTVDDTSAESHIVGDTQCDETVEVNGNDTEANAGCQVTRCFYAEQAADTQLNYNYELGYDGFCTEDEGSAEYDVDVEAEINGERLDDPVFHGNGTLLCGAADVTVEGIDPLTTTIPGERWQGSGSHFKFPIAHVEPNDELRIIVNQTQRVFLLPGADAGHTMSVKGRFDAFASGPFLVEGACPLENPCSSDVECTEPGTFCIDDTCDAPAFATNPNPRATTAPSPPTPGQLFTLMVSVDAGEGELLPETIVVTAMDGAVSFPTGLGQGAIVGGCGNGIGNFSIFVADEDTLVLDLDGDGMQDPDEPVGDITVDGNGTLTLTITVPPNASFESFGRDATITCAFHNLLTAGEEGRYTVIVHGTSIDLDGAGGSLTAPARGDAAVTTDFQPLEYSAEIPFVVGNPPTTTTTMTTTTTTTTTVPAARPCGDPVALVAGASPNRVRDLAVTASDALFILRTAVGSASCSLCECDVDGSGTIAATDALIDLKSAVGQPVSLNCPACN